MPYIILDRENIFGYFLLSGVLTSKSSPAQNNLLYGIYIYIYIIIYTLCITSGYTQIVFNIIQGHVE